MKICSVDVQIWADSCSSNTVVPKDIWGKNREGKGTQDRCGTGEFLWAQVAHNKTFLDRLVIQGQAYREESVAYGKRKDVC